MGRLKINVNPVSIPAGVTHREFLKELKPAVRGKRLPKGWEVDLEWRNPDTHSGRTRQWQGGEFVQVLTESSPGFSRALLDIIAEELGELPPQLGLFDEPKKPKKKRAPAQKAKAKKAAASKKKKLSIKQIVSDSKKRSAAAKKGWATRRAKAAAK